MSSGEEVYKPVFENWDNIDNLHLPELDNPYFEKTRNLGDSVQNTSVSAG
jgi:hypothetical protein